KQAAPAARDAADSAGASAGAPGETKSAPPDAKVTHRPRPPLDPNNPHAKSRAQLDEEVWQPEVEAQRHERPFIALWDRLRSPEGRSDPATVFNNFPFGKLELGTPGPAEDIGWGTTRAVTSVKPLRTLLDREGLRTWMSRREANEWKLVQSEWHHSKFEPARGGQPARSTFSILLHATRGARERVDVRGSIHVEWREPDPAAGPDAPPFPEVIDATELTITTREGALAFAPGPALDPEGDRAAPILVYDLDGDGKSEIVAAGGNVVYQNRGDMTFEPRPLLPGLPKVTLNAAALADFDGDHVVDLLAGFGAGGFQLFRGGAGGAFTGAAVPVKLDGPVFSPSVVTAGDIDGDGDLDAWVAQYKPPYRNGQMPTPYYDANDGFPSFLLINDGTGQFTDGTVDAGLADKRNRRTYSGSLVELDGDGDLDLLVVSDFAGVDLYLNDGKGRFRDVTADRLPERASFGMGHTMADYDGDGLLDLFVVGMSSTTARRLEQLGLGRDEFDRHQQMRMKMAYGNRMYVSDGKGHFREASFGAAVARTGWSWGASSFDADLDGQIDIYVANGNQSRGSAEDYCTTFWRHDIYNETESLDPELNAYFLDSFQDVIDRGVSWNGYEHNKLFLGRVTPSAEFQELGFQLGVAFEDDSRSVVVDDLDLDGRPDLIVMFSRSRAGKIAGETQMERVAVFKNVWEHEHHWIGVRLGGARSPIGA
ncbi:MAG: VCBS repeat-containing protein, partial [Myxococcales bacterium]|nr:VCBS repeat-containing protein [Myxococcales bacterium]